MVKKAKSVCSYKGVWIFTHTHTLIQTRREERKRVCVVRIIALSILVGWLVVFLKGLLSPFCFACGLLMSQTNKCTHLILASNNSSPKDSLETAIVMNLKLSIHRQTDRQTDVTKIHPLLTA